MSHLFRLLYRSDAALLGSSEDALDQLRSVVEISQQRNAAVGLTGAILLSAGVFVQVLEGPLNAIEQTFERICSDLRHRRVRLLEMAAAEQRCFGEWSMVQVEATRELARVGPALDCPEDNRIDGVTASAVIEMMRALLIAGATKAAN